MHMTPMQHAQKQKREKQKKKERIRKHQTCQYRQTVNQRESTKVFLLGASSYFKFSAFSRHSIPGVGFRVRVRRRGGGRHACATTAGDMRWPRLWLEAASVVPALHHSANGTPRVADESGKLNHSIFR
ncbi:unnamed protein product [Ixodes persulcatus]